MTVLKSYPDGLARHALFVGSQPVVGTVAGSFVVCWSIIAWTGRTQFIFVRRL